MISSADLLSMFLLNLWESGYSGALQIYNIPTKAAKPIFWRKKT